MADLCHSCALDTYGEEVGDLAGLSTPDDTAARRYPVALCEGCGPIQVNHTGRRVENGDDASTNTQAARLPRILNKHIHGVPKGAYYCGRGSSLGTGSSSGATAPATRRATNTTPGSTTSRNCSRSSPA